MIALWLALAGTASAQGLDGVLFGTNCDLRPLGGPSELALGTLHETNTNLLGALRFGEDALFAQIDPAGRTHDRPVTAIAARHDLSLGVDHLPVVRSPVSDNACLGEDQALSLPVDRSWTRLGIAHQGKLGGLFYVSSVNVSTVAPVAHARAFYPFLGAGWGYLYGIIAPVNGDGTAETDTWAASSNWIAGGSLHPASVDLRLAWVGTVGLYASAREAHSTLFVRAAAQRVGRQVFGTLPYLAAGVDDLPLGEALTERVGHTRLYARRIEWTLGAPVSVSPLDPDDPRYTDPVEGKPPVASLLTAHWEQTNAVHGHLDLGLILAAGPAPLLHEAAVGVHTRDFVPDTPARSQFGAGIRGGVVWLPEARYLGNGPGPRPTVSASLGGPLDQGALGHLHGGFRLNQASFVDLAPDTLGSASLFVQYSLVERPRERGPRIE